MKHIFKTLSLILAVVITASAQQIDPSEIEFKSGRSAGNTGEGKMKKAPKKLIISRFSVHYQLVYTDQDNTREGVNIGATSASLVVGFEGINEAQLQAITDELYADYVSKMESEGYSIVSVDEVAGTKAYMDAQRLVGGTVNYEVMGGYASTSPTGFERMYIDKAVKAAKARVKASQELGAVVAVVNLKIPFMIESEAGFSKLARDAVGGVSKVVASPGLRLDANGTSTSYQWEVQSNINLPLKKDVFVEGVFEDEKFKASSAAVTNTEYEVGHITRVHSWDVSDDQIRVAKGDPQKYLDGVKEASQLYLKKSSDVFLDYAKGK